MNTNDVNCYFYFQQYSLSRLRLRAVIKLVYIIGFIPSLCFSLAFIRFLLIQYE